MAPVRAADRASLAGGQQSAGSGNGGSQNASQNTSTGCTMPETDLNECIQTKLTEDIKIIAAYLAVEGTPAHVGHMLRRVQNAVGELLAGAQLSNTELAVQELRTEIRKISEKVENTRKPSYAAAAAAGAGITQAQNRNITTKAVPTRHKREITVTGRNLNPAQVRRTNKETIEQLNAWKIAGDVVAICQLQSGDFVLTMDEEQTRVSWLKDNKWLETFGAGARVKRREFAVLAHGIRVSQAQNQKQTIADIYKQNPRFTGTVEILRTAFSRKLLRSGRKIGPLIISVAEPEQANCLIDAGLIFGYELHNCEPYEGNCVVTQCFNCYNYGHEAGKCRNTGRCGFCGAPGHATNECIGKDDPGTYRCVPCRGKHQSWSRDCSVRKKQVEAAQAAYNQRPARYQTYGQGNRSSEQTPVLRPTRVVEPTVQVPGTQEPAPIPANTPATMPEFTFTSPHTAFTPASGWTTVRSKRNQSREPSINGGIQPVKRGRPFGSTKAAHNMREL